MNIVCEGCRCFLFKDELKRTSRTKGFICCNKGAVSFNMFANFPDQLRHLFEGTVPLGNDFRKNVRVYNNAFAMASVNCNISQLSGRGPSSFRIHGQIYRKIGPVEIMPSQQMRYAQLYTIDPSEAADARAGIFNLSNDTCKILSRLLSQKNVLAQCFKWLSEVLKEETEHANARNMLIPDIRLSFASCANNDRRYSNPMCDEVAIVYVSGATEEQYAARYLTVHTKDGSLKSISELSNLADPLAYPLFFPLGNHAWSPDMSSSNNSHRITQREFYAYILFTRNYFNPLHYGGKLFQQFVVDGYLKIETSRLNFHRRNQPSYRMESLHNLSEFVLHDEPEIHDIGRLLILPKSFTGGPRSMYCSYQDAMRIVSLFGKPDLFITFTANPKWREISDNLYENQTAADRPELVTRVFYLKLKELIDDIVKRKIFGSVQSYISVIEFQKRGLPHSHLLFTLQNSSKIRDARAMDEIVQAVIPDPDLEPLLYQRVVSHMLHRSCVSLGDRHAPCKKSNSSFCSKRFPKSFSAVSVINDDFPIYRRPENGRHILYKNQKIDNRYVVPYNPYLLKKFNSHINTELCGMPEAIKYLFKYVYKGCDMARIEIENVTDEISKFVEGRYISPPEAVHRILGFPIERRSHAVVNLTVHLPEEQYIRFKRGEEREAVNRGRSQLTTLQGFFNLNESRGEQSTSTPLFYSDLPKNYIFDKTRGWVSRRSTNKPVIGRMDYVPPRQTERYCLRLLLLHKANPISFDCLKTVNGTLLPTFKHAAIACGLLDDDNVYRSAFLEARSFQLPAQLRSLFISISGYIDDDEFVKLWNEFKFDLCEDFLRNGDTEEEAIGKLYHEMNKSLLLAGLTLPHSIPPPTQEESDSSIIDIQQLREIGQLMTESLNEEQQLAFNRIMNSVNSNNGESFYLDGPAGSGKTYIYTTVYNVLIGSGKKVLCSAFTGIAAQLLPNGYTCHSLFKMPLEFDRQHLTLNKSSAAAKLLQESDAFIIDEFSMISCPMLEFINITLQYVMENDKKFGGKTLICGGDFRQILPIARESDMINNCVKNSPLFSDFQTIKLKMNMRVSNDPQWSNFLLKIGDGSEQSDIKGIVNVPESMITSSVINEIYGSRLEVNSLADCSYRTILTSCNSSVDFLNQSVLEILDGEYTIVQSVDCHINDSSLPDLTTEFLNSLNPTGFPPHRLQLKKGAIVMLLRNLNISQGLCNGTRLRIIEINCYTLKCVVVSGKSREKEVMIPKIKLICDRNYSLKFSRYQFPVRLSFAMTIHKAQGQTFDKLGLYLEKDIFAHGQLYVALSRCKNSSNIHIQSPARQLTNIVDKRVLN